MNWTSVKHFTQKEFGPDHTKVAPELVRLLDDIRTLAEVPVLIHCSWSLAGHSAKSYHYTGQACDFHFGGLSYKTQYFLLREFREIGGLGFYPQWNTPGWHVDVRPGFLQWVQRDGKYLYGWKNMVKEF